MTGNSQADDQQVRIVPHCLDLNRTGNPAVHDGQDSNWQPDSFPEGLPVLAFKPRANVLQKNLRPKCHIPDSQKFSASRMPACIYVPKLRDPSTRLASYWNPLLQATQRGSSHVETHTCNEYQHVLTTFRSKLGFSVLEINRGMARDGCNGERWKRGTRKQPEGSQFPRGPKQFARKANTAHTHTHKKKMLTRSALRMISST